MDPVVPSPVHLSVYPLCDHLRDTHSIHTKVYKMCAYTYVRTYVGVYFGSAKGIIWFA